MARTPRPTRYGGLNGTYRAQKSTEGRPREAKHLEGFSEVKNTKQHHHHKNDKHTSNDGNEAVIIMIAEEGLE